MCEDCEYYNEETEMCEYIDCTPWECVECVKVKQNPTVIAGKSSPPSVGFTACRWFRGKANRPLGKISKFIAEPYPIWQVGGITHRARGAINGCKSRSCQSWCLPVIPGRLNVGVGSVVVKDIVVKKRHPQPLM